MFFGGGQTAAPKKRIKMDVYEKSLKAHEEWRGKIETKVRVPLETKEDLSIAYTPGVSAACLAIKDDVKKSFDLTRRRNTVPVITDGTAVLGLGDIGAEAGLPVMEGKSVLFKTFGDVDSYPLCISSKDPDDIVKTIKLLSGSWGGVNLEDISAPRCFEIEKRLKKELDIPVFHDDQHGTAIVVSAALINALKLAQKKIEDIRIVINGAGAAGISICKFLQSIGAKDIVVCDKNGILSDDPAFNEEQRKLALSTNPRKITGKLNSAMKNADVFIGVSGPNCVTKEMVASMNEKAIVFPLANPVSEIDPISAKEAGAFIVGTGSSVYPNQINNALVFPGLFRGAIDANACDITPQMMLAAAKGIAESIDEKDLSIDRILPLAIDKNAHKAVAKAVYEAALKYGPVRK